jgi:hypothetical protein
LDRVSNPKAVKEEHHAHYRLYDIPRTGHDSGQATTTHHASSPETRPTHRYHRLTASASDSLRHVQRGDGRHSSGLDDEHRDERAEASGRLHRRRLLPRRKNTPDSVKPLIDLVFWTAIGELASFIIRLGLKRLRLIRHT